MVIFDKRQPITVPFEDIKAGECFIDHDDELNLKLDISYYDVADGHPNAVVLESGQPWCCDDDEPVVKVRASVTIME